MNQDSSEIRCPHCGTWNPADREECIQCRQQLHPEQQPPAGEVPPPPHRPEPYRVQPPPSPQPGREPARSETETIVILGFVLAILGLLGCCCCLSSLVEIAAIILGAIAYSRGDQRGLWIIIIGAIALVLSAGINVFWLASPEMGPREFPGPWRRWV